MLLTMVFVTNDYNLYFMYQVLPLLIFLGIFFLWGILSAISICREERAYRIKKEEAAREAENRLADRYNKINKDFAKDIGLDKHD